MNGLQTSKAPMVCHRPRSNHSRSDASGERRAWGVHVSVLAHMPVLCAESLVALGVGNCGAISKAPFGGIYVDCTFGRGGHARALLQTLPDDARLIAFDRDPEAEMAAASLTTDARFSFYARPFSALSETLGAQGIDEVDGILADLGVSSPQLDNPARGFAFSKDGPLDMRMDPRRGLSAAEWLADVAEDDLADTLYYYGEERAARRIARALVRARENQPITRTAQLAALVADAMPGRPGHRHPATRTFQAIRIVVNAELKEVDRLLRDAPLKLKPGGRFAVISFHSLEDRQVKLSFRDWAAQASPNAPRFAVVGKPQTPSDAEVAANPRARSARLRVLERLG